VSARQETRLVSVTAVTTQRIYLSDEECRLLGCDAISLLWFLPESHRVISQKAKFSIVTAVETSNLT
jgi:hypothetical protein